jgi:hypothetical protein
MKKKIDLKKVAFSLASGLLLSTQAHAAASSDSDYGLFSANSSGENYSNYMAAGCSSNGCRSIALADEEKNGGKQSQQGCGGRHGCHGQSQQNGGKQSQQGCGSQHGCQGQSQQSGGQSSHGCGSSKPNYYTAEAEKMNDGSDSMDQTKTPKKGEEIKKLMADAAMKGDEGKMPMMDSKKNDEMRSQSLDSSKKSEELKKLTAEASGKVLEGMAATKKPMLTELELMTQLNAQSKAMYQSLSPEAKILVLKVVSQGCMGDKECQEIGTAALKDPNLAVKLVSDKMAEKKRNAPVK